jgi:hypothetical protein
VHNQEESSAARRLSDLRKAQPGDPTLQNLLGILSNKLDLCARLPIFEYEAGSQGHETCAAAFHRLAEIERRSFNEMLVCLREHLDETMTANGVVTDGRP